MEKTEDGKRFKSSEHGNRAGSMADNEGGWVDGKMTAAPLLHVQDPSLRFGFVTGHGARVANGTSLLQVKAATFKYPNSQESSLNEVDLSVSAGDIVDLFTCILHKWQFDSLIVQSMSQTPLDTGVDPYSNCKATHKRLMYCMCQKFGHT